MHVNVPGTPVMTKEVIGLVDELYEMRLETLLSVQDLLEAVVGSLEVRTLTVWLMFLWHQGGTLSYNY